MAERICDHCGNKRSVSGGKTCDSGHFVCSSCIYKSIGVFSSGMKECPLCKKNSNEHDAKK